MKALWKVLVGIFALIGVAYMGLVLSLKTGLLGERSCEIYPVSELDSPSQKYFAEQVQEKCTPDNIAKSVVWIKNQETGARWTVFTAKTKMENQSLESITASVIELKWLDIDTLQIKYPPNLEIESSLIGYEQGGVNVTGRTNDI